LFAIKYKFNLYIAYLLLLVLTTLNIFSINLYIKNSDHKTLQTFVSNNFKKDVYNNKCLYVLFDNEYYTAFSNLIYTYNYEFLENFKLREKIFNDFSCIVFVDDKYCYDNSS
jgi:hypothetical protein